MRTHYDNLHISEKASPEVIRAAYKALAQKWHPDKNPDQREKAERYFKIISSAFDVLCSPESRAEYDAELKAQRGAKTGKPEPDLAKEPPQKSHQENQSEAWEDGKRSHEQGFKEKDCPYNGELAASWQQGFKAGISINSKKSLIARLWRGEEGLGKTFWLYGVIGVNVIGLIAFAALSASAAYMHGDFKTGLPRAALQASAIYWIYAVFMLVGIWRSAGKVRPVSGWALAARVVCLAPLIGMASIFIMTLFELRVAQQASVAPQVIQSQRQVGSGVLSQEEIHLQRIYAAHPDADSILKTQDFELWVAGQSDRERRVKEGTTEEVIQLFSEYKTQKAP